MGAMTRKYFFYQEGDMFIGWFEEFPDYKTQGESLQELGENLKELFHELTSGNIPNVRHIGELQVA